ncbi:SPFH domain-containing protein [Chitinibacter tainanensis]|uniref:SPFH domain-containing protein n=1 Tax=Chitinibacter tainanensis TaxID=230667 RepID=UPI0004022DDB|nr:SPFH domain-containing protein [Chitinibacter tainanensis]
MKRIITSLLTICFAVALTACGKISTGEVGVKTNSFNGNVVMAEMPVGMYFEPFNDVEKFTAKDVTLELPDLKVQGSDKLAFKDFDIAVIYSVKPETIAELKVKYRNQYDCVDGECIPGSKLVARLASTAAMDVVSRFDSLTAHQKRDEIRKAIQEKLQAELNARDPDTFQIKEIVISTMLTDQSIEDANRKAVAAQKDLELAQKRVDIAREQALANEQLAKSLTPNLLQMEYVKALNKFAERKDGSSVIILPADFKGMVNVPAK